jgi:2-polyprenyl-3-methyl-5-hydroxy-6-metoxy-1,4-benzoquinol methylase
MRAAGHHSARLDDLQPAYARAQRQTWFAQWYERNALNLRWLLDDRHLPKTPGRTLRVLELGIGWGGASLCLARAGAYVVGLDDFEDGFESQGIPQMRFLAAQGVHVVRGSVLQVPLRKSSFDIVILNDVLEHMSVPKRLLRAVGDLLRPDGLFVMEVPNSVALYKRVRVLCGLSNYFRMEHFFRDDDYRGHVREYTKAEIRYMLEKTGFAPIEIRGVNQAHRPWFESHGPQLVTRPVLRIYDALAGLRDSWKDHFCCLARKNSLTDGLSAGGKD